MEKFTTTHSKNDPPKYVIVWATPILWLTPKKIICLLNPNTIAQIKVSMQHVGMLLNHYLKLLLSIFVWIFSNLISWHYIPRGAKYGCCWPSGYGNSCLAMSRPFSRKYMWWFAWPTIKIFWGATMNVVTFATHSKVSIHLHFRKFSSILWIMVSSFGGMATNPCLVGKTNFVGCCINEILNTSLIVMWTNITPNDWNMLMISYNLKLSPWMPFWIQNACHKWCDMMIGHLLPLSTRWAKHGWPCAHKLPCFLWWWFRYDLGFKILLLGGTQCLWTWMCYGVPYPCYLSFWPIKGHQMLNPWSSYGLKLPHLSY